MQLYLSSYDYRDFWVPRTVLEYSKMRLDSRNVLAIKVAEPVIGQKFGFEGNDVSVLYLVNRFDEQAFDKLDKFPIDVHVLLPKRSADLVPSSLSDLESIVWASLYDNEADALNHKMK